MNGRALDISSAFKAVWVRAPWWAGEKAEAEATKAARTAATFMVMLSGLSA